MSRELEGWVRRPAMPDVVAPRWAEAVLRVTGRPPRTMWVTFEARRSVGDPTWWSRVAGVHPWRWLANLHAILAANRPTSPLVERASAVIPIRLGTRR